MNSSLQTQPTLLVRIRDAQDQEAWRRFVDIYAPLVYGFLRKRGLQDADAADLTQDVLRQVSSAFRSFEYNQSRGSFRSWLFAIVKNRLVDFWRRENVCERGTGDTDAHQRLGDVADASHDPVSAEWDADYHRQLFLCAATAIRQDFSESSWQAFWSSAVEGKSGKEVAEQLGLSVAAVYLAKGRVMARLKEQLRLLSADAES